MANRKAVDARTNRARRRLRCIKAEVADFCAARARLIVREECGDRERWVYCGGDPTMPLRWSIEVGEFVHNLRSALDHLVRQLATAHGECVGRHGGDTCPGRHSRFPMPGLPGARRFEKQVCGVGPRRQRVHQGRAAPATTMGCQSFRC